MDNTRATLIAPTPNGGWCVSYYYAVPDSLNASPYMESYHAYRWLARLHAWLFMNGQKGE